MVDFLVKNDILENNTLVHFKGPEPWVMREDWGCFLLPSDTSEDKNTPKRYLNNVSIYIAARQWPQTLDDNSQLNLNLMMS